jgi:hypothetical protein
MKRIFGLLFFVILICLIYLYYQGKISRNIPIIFMFFIILIIPFTYLEKKNDIESYSDYDQVMNASLDIFYTKDKSKRRQLNELKKIKLIKDPVQTVIVQKQVEPIILQFFTLYWRPYTAIYISYQNKYENLYTNFSNVLIYTYITNDNLVNKDYQKIKENIKQTYSLKYLTDNLDSYTPNNSYIIIIGNNGHFLHNNDVTPTVKTTLKNKFKFGTWVDNNWWYTGAFIVLLSKSDSGVYTKINEKFTQQNNYISITQNIMADPIYVEKLGVDSEFKKVATQPVDKPIEQDPIIKSKINIISPSTANTNYALSFTIDNNQSFVYLSSRKLEDTMALYAKSPKDDIGPVSTTYLNTEKPQLWTFEPVTKYITSPLIVFIRTYTKPYFYLDTELENGVMILKASRFKSGMRQKWELIKQGTTGSIYKIRSVNSGMYLAFSDFDGYLYKDDGSVFLTKSENYTWNIKIIPEQQLIDANKNLIEGFTETEVPSDYGSNDDPVWKITYTANGKEYTLESKGRTVWDEKYSEIWNGNWIYYGTVESYKATLDINNVDFLKIKVNADGKGIVDDQFHKFKINVINAGSNILTGIIPSGKYQGYRANFILIPTNLKYSGPLKTFPVKMRYYIEKMRTISEYNFPKVVGIATQYNIVPQYGAIGVTKSGNWYSSWCANTKNNVCNAEYRLVFSNGSISNLTIKSESPSGLTNPDISFGLSDVPNDIIAVLQGRKIGTEKWFDVNVPSVLLIPNQKTVKFSGNTGEFKKTTSFFANKIIYNFSSGNIYNMEGYATKMVTEKLVLANFLEASGIQTDPNLAFTEQNMVKLNNGIKQQLALPDIIRDVNKFFPETNKIKSANLLYKSSIDGATFNAFHKKCDRKGPTISIARLKNKMYIGAYSPISWGLIQYGGFIRNKEAFLFDNVRKYTCNNPDKAIYQSFTAGPTFGEGFDFYTFNRWAPGIIFNNPKTYSYINKGPFDVPLNTNKNYELLDLEVYSVTPTNYEQTTFEKIDKTNCVYGRIYWGPKSNGFMGQYKYLGEFNSYEDCAKSPNIPSNAKAITYHDNSITGWGKQCFSINDNETAVGNQSYATCGIRR